MVTAKVTLTDDARDDFHDLDRSAQRIVAAGLKKLQEDPHLRGQPLGSRAGGDLTTFRKLVVGNKTCRIIYRIDPDGTVVVVWVIGKRADDEAYELAMARLKMHADTNIRGLATSLEHVWER
ncbi:type II toxin-antitoxin system RelE family toxin [Pseudonocardia sp. CA-107938]|uniref:type II toxin-antitoxin system RelE family toxin n=1 Tax=Pseudonocardia sp. CA-107938 TaxID=3240021 RepID=UPI003D8FDF59